MIDFAYQLIHGEKVFLTVGDAIIQRDTYGMEFLIEKMTQEQFDNLRDF